jgi:hypothetical protein
MGMELGLCLSSKEHRLGVLDNRPLRKIFGHRREEVTRVVKIP